MWVKRCMKMHVILFKNWKCVFEWVYQTPPLSFTYTGDWEGIYFVQHSSLSLCRLTTTQALELVWDKFFFFVETIVILTFNQTVLKLVESYRFSVFMVELVFFGVFFFWVFVQFSVLLVYWTRLMFSSQLNQSIWFDF